jgi:hypothetical protein
VCLSVRNYIIFMFKCGTYMTFKFVCETFKSVHLQKPIGTPAVPHFTRRVAKLLTQWENVSNELYDKCQTVVLGGGCGIWLGYGWLGGLWLLCTVDGNVQLDCA